jgi:hypothetical protein
MLPRAAERLVMSGKRADCIGTFGPKRLAPGIKRRTIEVPRAMCF